MKISAKAAPHRANLFFIEMIIVLLFFGISSAVILRTFAASDEISRESDQLEKMSFCAQSAAEIFSDTGSLPHVAKQLFGIDTDEKEVLTIPLDSKCGYNESDPSVYLVLSVTELEQKGLFRLDIRFNNADGGAVYQVKSGAYCPDKKDGADNGQ